jgi:signal transduction histidine kinase/ActR/RegA family two-component response regulator
MGSFSNPPPLDQATLSRVERFLKLICALIGADWAGSARLSASGELLEHTIHRTSDASRDPHKSGAILQFILRRHGMRYRCDPNELVAEGQSASTPHESVAGLSFAAKGRSRGLIYLVRSPDRPAFVADEVKMLQTFRAWMEQESLVEESDLLTKLRVLNRVAQLGSNELPVSHRISQSLHELERYFPLHLHSVWLVDSAGEQETTPAVAKAPSFLVLAEAEGNFAERSAKLGLHPGWRIALDETPFEPCLHGESAFYVDLRQPRDADNLLCRQLSERGGSFLFAVPLRAGKRTVGMLQIVSTCAEGFTSDHVQTLYLVADLLGPGISNSQLVLRLRTACEHLRTTQDKLIQTEKMRALGELASGVAHNFNNSLCSVLGFLEIAMADPALPADSRCYLEASRLGALDAAQIVRRVQEFALPRQERVGFEPLDVNELVAQAVDLARPKWEAVHQLHPRPIEVVVDANGAAVVNGAPTDLREVLTNLIFNAVDAMPHGGRITVRTWNGAADAFISIEDTGVGMTDFVRQRVFEPLFTTKGRHGTGLGLSISFSVIQRHGGEIVVDSTLGAGSTFTVRLPILAAVPAAIGNADVPKPISSAQHASSASHGRHVLVIEDEEAVRSFLEVALVSLGYRPRLAVDGEEGLRLLAEETFDLVMTDVGLPGIGGEEVARLVAHRSPGMPVILLTGWADQISSRIGAAEEVARVLGKPIRLDALAVALAEAIASRRGAINA